MEKGNFAVDAFNENVERFGSTVNVFIPAEIRDDGEINMNEGTRY